jgi:hypothetical protein
LKENEKGCHNCVHRFGLMRNIWQCSRTGYFTETEMKCGGRCADGKEGADLRLWAPRPTPLRRILNVIRLDDRSTRDESSKDYGGWIGGA